MRHQGCATSILEKCHSDFILRGDGETASIAESLGRYLQARSRLLTLVFGTIHHARRRGGQSQYRIRVRRRSSQSDANLPRSPPAQHREPHTAAASRCPSGRAAIRLTVAFLESSRGMTARREFTYSAQPIHQSLRNVRDYRQPADHVTIERAVAHAEFALVAGREHDRSELVRQRHQQVPRARDCIFSSVTSSACARENASQCFVIRLVCGIDRKQFEADAKILRQGCGRRQWTLATSKGRAFRRR